MLAVGNLEALPSDKVARATTINNVAYGDHPRQKMDVYLPDGRTIDSTKVLILIHGGGWTNGDKSDFNQYVSALQHRLPGYAIFNVNYRLAGNGKNLFPSQENDIKSAVEFIYRKRNEYKISNHFAYMGASAGAHLALLQAYKHARPLKPKAVVSFFGPTELTALYRFSPMASMILSQVTGAAPASDVEIYRSSSPIEFVNEYSPPTLLLHGGRDPLVPFTQSELLKTALNKAKVANDYIFYPSERHGWMGDSLSDSFDKVARFLQEHM
jgi:acetyl esterase/lipase